MSFKPDEEAISAFFDGFTKIAYYLEVADEGGRKRNSFLAEEIYAENSIKFFKQLHQFYFRELTEVDSMEISMEFTYNSEIQYFQGMFMMFAGYFKTKEVEFNYTEGSRDFFLRPISHEAVISFFIGLSWFLKGSEEKRGEKLEWFLDNVKNTMCKSMDKERMLDLLYFYYNDSRIEELRMIGFDMMDVRFAIQGKPPKQL